MKKIVAIILITASFSSFSQARYTMFAHCSNSKVIKSGTCDMRVYSDGGIISFIFSDGKITNYTLFGGVDKGQTYSGYRYTAFQSLNENNQKIILQFFQEQRVLRLVFEDGETLEFR